MKTSSAPGARRRHLRWILPLVAAGAVVAFLLLRRTPVELHTVAAAPVQAEVMGTGTLEARVSATISPRVVGRLASVAVDQGARVEAGQLLATLDDAEARQQLAVAEAALQVSAAALACVRTDHGRAQAVLSQARLEHTRLMALAENGTLSDSDRDKAVEKLHIAEAEEARARAAIDEATAQHHAATSQVALQKELVAHTRLLAPFAGLIVRRDRDPGDVVTPGSSVLQLISPDEIWVSAWVDETAAAGLAEGQAARIVFRSEPATSYPGRAVRLGRETDRETREFLVDVALERLPANWTLGQRAEVFIVTAQRASALAVPARFLSYRDGSPGVFVVHGGRARWTAVETGLRNARSIELVRGVAAGDALAAPLQPGLDLQGRRVAPR